MKVSVYSRNKIEKLINEGRFPDNTAVVSFYNSPSKSKDVNYTHVDYSNVCEMYYYIELDDLGFEVLRSHGFSYETFFTDAGKVAEFICQVHDKGMNLICQCEHGQGRSAGCAAAVLEYYCRKGIVIFTDYRFNPNKVIYHKLLEALRKRNRK